MLEDWISEIENCKRELQEETGYNSDNKPIYEKV